MPRTSHQTPRGLLVAILILAATGSVAGAGIAYTQYQRAASPTRTAIAQDDAIIRRVAKLVTLPQTERPQIATIQDAAKLQERYKVFDTAANGDYVLFYPQNKRAVVYRLQQNKLIADAPLTSL